jgi:LPS sulfotransferase NodH
MRGLDVASWLALHPAPTSVTKTLIVAYEERSGSEWLCEMLSATGLLGRPAEMLNTEVIRRFVVDYPEEVSDQISIAKIVSTTANGCFSIKLNPWLFDRISQNDDWLNYFPSPQFVRISRADLLGQAISLVRARQTGKWIASHDENGALVFDESAIALAIKEIVRNRARWDAYFGRNAIEPLCVKYEDLQRKPNGIISDIGLLMGERIKTYRFKVSGKLGVQRDELSSEWKDRFLEKQRNLGYLDAL